MTPWGLERQNGRSEIIGKSIYFSQLCSNKYIHLRPKEEREIGKWEQMGGGKYGTQFQLTKNIREINFMVEGIFKKVIEGAGRL